MQTISAICNTIILLGAIQGLIFGVLLYRKRETRPTSRLLSVLLFCMASASCKLYGSMFGWFDSPVMRWVEAFVPMIVIMPLGPLIFFYVRSMLEPDFRMSRRDRIHFYPVLIDLVPQLTALIFVLGLTIGIFQNNPQSWGQFIDQYNVYSDLPRWGSLTFYCWMSWRLLRAHENQQALVNPLTHRPRQLIAGVPTPPTTSPDVKWLRQIIRFFLIFQVIWFLYLIPYCIPRYTDVLLNLVDWYPIYVPMALLIYWMGIKGFVASQSMAPAKERQKTAIPDGTLERLVAAMEEDRLYLDPALTLATVSAHTGISQKNISAALNGQLQKTFNEFVNEYRVGAMKERLLLGDSRSCTIAGIAYECGFNSLPTFQRAFKAITGETPREFLSKNALS